MIGVDFLVDENGNKKAAVIDLEKYGEAFEDFMDGLIATNRKSEKKSSLATVKKRLANR